MTSRTVSIPNWKQPESGFCDYVELAPLDPGFILHGGTSNTNGRKE